jgi:mannitol-specific phosphotransferase system IIBC component
MHAYHLITLNKKKKKNIRAILTFLLNNFGEEIANIVICCLSIFVVAGLVIKCFRRKAAVARMEMMSCVALVFLYQPTLHSTGERTKKKKRHTMY